MNQSRVELGSGVRVITLPRFDIKTEGEGLRTVYLLGAGVNQCIRDGEGNSPPLANTFFTVAGRMGGSPKFLSQAWMAPVLDYLEKRNKLGVPRQLVPNHLLNIEALLDSVKADANKARAAGCPGRARRLDELYNRVVYFIGSVISSFHHAPAEELSCIQRLAQIIWQEHATVITFNYDTFVEDWLEFASTQFPAPTHERTYGWQRELGYGITFDELDWRDRREGDDKVREGSEFYSNPGVALNSLRVLKLHGSLNWSRYSSRPGNPRLGVPSQVDTSTRPGKTVLTRDVWSTFGWPQRRNLELDPMIITGSMAAKAGAIRVPPFDSLWSQAASVLRTCERLISIGYSYADDHTRQLLLSNVDPGKLKFLVSVGPSLDTAETLRNLCGGGKRGIFPARPRSVEEFVLHRPGSGWENFGDWWSHAGLWPAA